MKLKLILSAALVLSLLSAPAATETAAPAAADTNATPADAVTALFGDPVIARGKGFEIKRSELDSVLTGAKANAAAQGQMLPPDVDIQVLNQLVTIQLLLQKATAADRAAGQTEADLEFTNVLKHFGSQEAFDRQLKASGVTADQLRAKATQEATANAAMRRELNVVISDDAAKNFYDTNTAAFEQPEMAHVRHILLLTSDPATQQPLSTNTIAAKRKTIDELLQRAKAGEDFATLAKQYSEDPGSKANGGEMSAFPRGQMVPEFDAAAFALTNGQISDVITTVYGYHIIQMIAKTPAKKFGFDEVIPQINETVRTVCKRELEGGKLRELAPAYVKQLRAESGVEILDPNLKALEQAILDAGTNASPSGGAGN